MQRGYIYKRSGAWWLRYRAKEFIDGQLTSVQHCARLATVGDAYRSKQDLRPLVERVLEPLNRGGGAEGGLTFAAFFEKHFLPHVEGRRKPSTVKFYRDAFNNHLKHRVGQIRLRDFTTAHAQAVLDDIKLTHQSLLRIKTAMSAMFTVARQKDFIRSANPIVGARAEGTRSTFKPHAYTLNEVAEMMATLPEPARTVCAVAAFSGLRHGELRGLRWSDYDGERFQVQRSIWRTHVGETKTDSSSGAVPVIPFLQKVLATHRERVGGKGYIFAGEKKGFALTLDNLTGRVIRPALGDAWKGWHAFRRSLATNLYELGVPPKIIQAILRHSRVETTQRHYIVVEQQKAGSAAMKKLERAVKRAQSVRKARTTTVEKAAKTLKKSGAESGS